MSAPIKLAYYPGCTMKNHARNFEDATWSAMASLGVEMEELKRWNCCGTVYSLAVDDIMRRLAPIRNLIRAKQGGASEFATACAMCYNTIKRANNHVKEYPETLSRMNEFMDQEPDYHGDVSVTHLLEFLRDKVGFEAMGEKVKKPLKGLKVACYYGCLLMRPRSVAFDDPENPKVMENLVQTLGAEPVDFAHKMECCAAYKTVDRPDIVADQTYKILTSAKGQGADVVMVSCPLCAFNLDQRQELALERHPELRHLPVVYFTQLMALALESGETALDSKRHHIDPRPVLAAKELV